MKRRNNKLDVFINNQIEGINRDDAEFIKLIVSGESKSQAFLHAYPLSDVKNAGQGASRKLKKPEIQRAIIKIQQKIQDMTGLSVKNLVTRLNDIASVNWANYYYYDEKTGRFTAKTIHELTDRELKATRGMESRVLFDLNGEAYNLNMYVFKSAEIATQQLGNVMKLFMENQARAGQQDGLASFRKEIESTPENKKPLELEGKSNE